MSLPKSEYTIFSGQPKDFESRLAELPKEGWKPILMSSSDVGGSVPIVTVIFEREPGAGK